MGACRLHLAAILTMVALWLSAAFYTAGPGVSLLQLQLSAIVARCCRSLLSLVSIVPVYPCASSQRRRAEETPNMCRYGVQILHLDQGRPSECRRSVSNRRAFAYRDRFLRPEKRGVSRWQSEGTIGLSLVSEQCAVGASIG